MILLRLVKLTPHQAKELSHWGFIVKFIQINNEDQDLYEVYVRT